MARLRLDEKMATGITNILSLVSDDVSLKLPFPEPNPFSSRLKSLHLGGQEFKYYDVRSLGGEKFGEWGLYRTFHSTWV